MLMPSEARLSSLRRPVVVVITWAGEYVFDDEDTAQDPHEGLNYIERFGHGSQ